MTNIIKRIDKLESINQVRNAVHDVTMLQDVPYDPLTANFYTLDGVSDSGAFGVFRGREAIKSLYETLTVKFDFTVHYKLCGVIDISDGGPAVARWVSLEAPNIKGEAIVGALRQETIFKFVDRQCLVSNYAQSIDFMVPYKDGWASDNDRSSRWNPST